MGGQDGDDLRPCISAQTCLDPGHVGGGTAAEIHDLDIHTHGTCHIGPAQAKSPRGQHQDLIAARKQVGVHRFPQSMAIADIAGHVVHRARDSPQIGPKRGRQAVQLALVDVRRGAVHGALHAVGHDRGAGDRKIGAAMGQIDDGGHLASFCGILSQGLACPPRPVNLAPALASSGPLIWPPDLEDRRRAASGQHRPPRLDLDPTVVAPQALLDRPAAPKAPPVSPLLARLPAA